MVVARADYNIIIIYFHITNIYDTDTNPDTVICGYGVCYVLCNHLSVSSPLQSGHNLAFRSRSLISAMPRVRVQHFSYISI